MTIAVRDPKNTVVKRRPGRKSEAERAVARKEAHIEQQREAETARKVELYARQESKRAQPIQPDQAAVLGVSLALAGIAMIASGIISFNGITSVAQFVGLSFDWQAWMFFGFIELLIVVFTILYLVLGSRVSEDGAPADARIEFTGLVTFSAIAVYGNLIHTLGFHEFDLTTVETWTGVVLSVAAPVAVIWLTKSASRVLFARPVRL